MFINRATNSSVLKLIAESEQAQQVILSLYEKKTKKSPILAKPLANPNIVFN